MCKNCSNTVAFIAGVGIGSAIGILFSPEKGTRTRSTLKYKLKAYKASLKDLLEELMHHKSSTPNKAKSASQQVISDAQIKAKKLLGDVDELLEKFES